MADISPIQSQEETLAALTHKAKNLWGDDRAEALKSYLENLEDAGVDPNRRPETLIVEEWVKIAQSIQ